jgi:hypothetical protein
MSLGRYVNVEVINEQGLVWDNAVEFSSLDSEELTDELARIALLLEQANQHMAAPESPRLLQGLPPCVLTGLAPPAQRSLCWPPRPGLRRVIRTSTIVPWA